MFDNSIKIYISENVRKYSYCKCIWFKMEIKLEIKMESDISWKYIYYFLMLYYQISCFPLNWRWFACANCTTFLVKPIKWIEISKTLKPQSMINKTSYDVVFAPKCTLSFSFEVWFFGVSLSRLFFHLFLVYTSENGNFLRFQQNVITFLISF